MTVIAHSVIGEVTRQIAAGTEETPIYNSIPPVSEYREPAGPFAVPKAKRQEIRALQNKVLADAAS